MLSDRLSEQRSIKQLLHACMCAHQVSHTPIDTSKAAPAQSGDRCKTKAATSSHECVQACAGVEESGVADEATWRALLGDEYEPTTPPVDVSVMHFAFDGCQCYTSELRSLDIAHLAPI